MGAHTTQCLDCRHCFNGCPGANLDGEWFCPSGFDHQKRDLGPVLTGECSQPHPGQIAWPSYTTPEPPYETRLRDEVAMRLFVLLAGHPDWQVMPDANIADRSLNAADAFMAERARRQP